MIVQPDFLDHWKTALFKRLIKQPDSIEFILRLWAHCQQRRGWKFKHLSNDALAAVCKFSGDSTQLYQAFEASGYAYRKDDILYVHDWEYVNATLISNWKKGKYGINGGRPRTPRVRDDKPSGLDDVGVVKPDWIGLDGSREDKKTEVVYKYPRSEKEARASAASAGVPEEYAAQLWNEMQGIGWRDAVSRPIDNWPYYLKGRWGKEQNRKLELKDSQKLRDQQNGNSKANHRGNGIDDELKPKILKFD